MIPAASVRLPNSTILSTTLLFVGGVWLSARPSDCSDGFRWRIEQGCGNGIAGEGVLEDAMRRELESLAFPVVGAVVLLLATSPIALGKQGVEARVKTQIPLDAAAGETVEIAWTLTYVERGKRRPFNADAVFVRLLNASGGSPSTGFAAPGAHSLGQYVAESDRAARWHWGDRDWDPRDDRGVFSSQERSVSASERDGDHGQRVEPHPAVRSCDQRRTRTRFSGPTRRPHAGPPTPSATAE